LDYLQELFSQPNRVTKREPKNRDELLGQLLIDARRKAGLTQDDVAKKLGRKQAYVSKYELGQRKLDVIEFLSIAEAIGIDPIQIIKKLK
jgi:transcriptional regulator with XRE-family HTH domain